MKFIKLVYMCVLSLSITNFGFAQVDEKIKGDRDVTIKQTYMDAFNSIIIKNDFEVKIAYNSKPSVEIEADDNLHEIINVSVIDGVLNISADKRIISKKKLVITVNYSDNLQTIELYDDTELRSLTSLELKDFTLKVENNSRAYLNIKANSFHFSAAGKSKSRLNIVADSTKFVLSDNSKIDMLVSGRKSSFDLYQRADVIIEGDAESTFLRLDNSSNFLGKNYNIKNADLLIESSSNAIMNVETLLKLKASGNSETYIYGSPKIELTLFSDTAKLHKKEN